MDRRTDKSAKRQTNDTPARTPNGVKVYYDGATEAFLRRQAEKEGFRNVQEYLKFDARRKRLEAESRGER